MIVIVKMIESAAGIILAVLFLMLLGNRLDRSFWVKSVAFGVAFGVTGMISLALPVEFAPGYLTDARNVSVALGRPRRPSKRRRHRSNAFRHADSHWRGGSVCCTFRRLDDRGRLVRTMGLLRFDYVPDAGRKVQVEHAICNCVGFGSKNSALVLRRSPHSR